MSNGPKPNSQKKFLFETIDVKESIRQLKVALEAKLVALEDIIKELYENISPREILLSQGWRESNIACSDAWDRLSENYDGEITRYYDITTDNWTDKRKGY